VELPGERGHVTTWGMSGRSRLALLLATGVALAVACGADDGDHAPPSGGEAGMADVPEAGSGAAPGGAPAAAGSSPTSGRGGSQPVSGGGGSATAGANDGDAGSEPLGGAGGDGGANNAGEAGASGGGGDSSLPTLFADDFDAEHLEAAGLYTANYVEFGAWDVASGSVDVTVLPNGFIASPGGYGASQLARGVVVDLNGSTQQDGVLTTKSALTFEAGVTYTLRYVLGNAKNQTNAVTVSIAGLLSETRTQVSVQAFTPYESTFTPVAPVVAPLVFSSAGGADDDGLLLDSVSIRY
jgi:hypothetical protein